MARRSFGKIKKLPSGNYHASYVGADGKRHNAPTTFPKKIDADGWLSRQQAALVESRWKPPVPKATTMTLAEYLPIWWSGRTLKATTVDNYTALLERWILPFLSDVALIDLARDVVRDWYDMLATRTTPNQQGDAYNLLRSILNGAVDDEKITDHGATIKRADKGAKRDRTPIVLSNEDVTELCALMPPRYTAYILLAIWCSLRRSELAGIRRRHIDLKAATLTIERAVPRTVKKRFVEGTPKSEAGKRTVAIPPPIIQILATHLLQFAAPGRHGLVFCSPTDPEKFLTPDTFDWHWHKARAKIGLPDLKLHDARHTGATKAGEAGATLAELMVRLGHSTPTAAMTYQHASKERDREIARRMGEMMVDPDTDATVVSLDSRREVS